MGRQVERLLGAGHGDYRGSEGNVHSTEKGLVNTRKVGESAIKKRRKWTDGALLRRRSREALSDAFGGKEGEGRCECVSGTFHLEASRCQGAAKVSESVASVVSRADVERRPCPLVCGYRREQTPTVIEDATELCKGECLAREVLNDVEGA